MNDKGIAGLRASGRDLDVARAKPTYFVTQRVFSILDDSMEGRSRELVAFVLFSSFANDSGFTGKSADLLDKPALISHGFFKQTILVLAFPGSSGSFSLGG